MPQYEIASVPPGKVKFAFKVISTFVSAPAGQRPQNALSQMMPISQKASAFLLILACNERFIF